MDRNKKWQTSQILEKKWYRLPKKHEQKEIVTTSKALNKRFNLSDNFFYRKTVLEVGVALSGEIHYIGGARLKVGLDPLAKYFASQYPKSAEHIQGRGEELPFFDNCLDTIICLNVLDHTEKPELVLQEMRRCLKKGGLLLFSVNVFSVPKFLRKNLLPKIDPKHPHHFSEQEVKSMLKQTEFDLTSCFHLKFSPKNRLNEFGWYVRNNKITSIIRVLVAKFLFGLQDFWVESK